MTIDTPQSIDIEGRTVCPEMKRQFRYDAATTYHGDAVELPVTVIDGERTGPTIFLSATVHGDELNGIEIIQEVADKYELADIVTGLFADPHELEAQGFTDDVQRRPDAAVKAVTVVGEASSTQVAWTFEQPAEEFSESEAVCEHGWGWQCTEISDQLRTALAQGDLLHGEA